MAGFVSIDASELRTLTADLTSAGARVAGEVRPLVQAGAMAIKKQMRAEMGASAHFKGAAQAIDFDLIDRPGDVTAEIGPKVGTGQVGGLGGIAYFGSSRGGGTVADPQGALDAEAPRLERAIADLGGRFL